MLGDSLNYFNNTSLNRFYISSMATSYPLEKNAFDVQLRRCQARKLRSMDGLVDIHDTEDTSEVAFEVLAENNVVRMYGREAIAPIDELIIARQRRKLAWKVHFIRGMDNAEAS